MNKRILFLGLILCFLVSVLFISCNQEKNYRVQKLNFTQFEPILQKQNDTVYVINFWATWCKPCIKEMPDFERINNDFRKSKVKVYLVSLDFPDKHDALLIPFLKEHKIKSEVIHLTDTDANSWIDKVSPFWSGAIPATVIYKGTSREFYEKTLNYDELKKIVESKI
jgi:thiol-disulfide isomerase/thioredoxin